MPLFCLFHDCSVPVPVKKIKSYIYYHELSSSDLFKNECLVAVAVREIKIFGAKEN